MGCLAGPGMVIASHNLDCLLKDGRASPPLLRFVKQDTTVGLMEALGSESGSEQFETDGAPLRFIYSYTTLTCSVFC